MITWMQRHKKWLIVTIWISTIAFVGAGFVGWGQYSYGDKAGAVAKVGNIEITMGEMQKSYSRLYAKFNQMFQGNFDEEKAKQFGLQKKALDQLVQQALILNLAESYSLEVTDKEVLAALTKQEWFFNQAGVFDKEVYKKALSRNNMSMKEYEDELKKSLLIVKTLALLPVEESPKEKDIMKTVMSIADKLNYKVLSEDQITVETSDAVLKPFWEQNKESYKTDVSYELHVIKQVPVTKKYDDAKISSYYTENKTHFKAEDGKIMPLELAKPLVIAELNAKATKDAALRTYIAYKKAKLDKSIAVDAVVVSNSNNPYNATILEKIKKLTPTAPFMKPVLIEDTYYIFELTKINPAQTKSYEMAKEALLPLYVSQTKTKKLKELAVSTVEHFTGETTGFITNADAEKLIQLNPLDAKEFLSKLFTSTKKKSYIVLNNGKIVLYNILEQKLLQKQNNEQTNSIAQLKSAMFDEGLIKNLQNKYQTEIFIEGL
jgi:peptidyl-prolyl cis-trans isomerase D